MRIEINLKLFFIIILLFLFNNLGTYIIFLIFVTLHEMGHLLYGIIIGGKPKAIYLNPLGISLEFYSYGKEKTLNRICLFAIGPLINIIFAIIFIKLPFTKYSETIIFTNLALAFLNLIPIIPLDGGKILFEFIKVISNKAIAYKFVIIFSKVFLIAVSLLYSVLILKLKNLFILILLIYLWILYLREEKKYNLYELTRRSLEI